jgi:hypothetical protein
VGFFSDLHRSIFDPYFYREVLRRPRGRVLMFMVKLLVFSALVVGAARTYYLVHAERGIAPLVSTMFDGVEIRDGQLATERELPIEVPGDMLATLFNRFVGNSQFLERLPDNFLVVDTRIPPAFETVGATAPKIHMKESSIEFREIRMDLPYRYLLGSGNLLFTKAAVQEFLNRNVGAFLVHFVVAAVFLGFFSIMMSVCFLSLAAFIFSMDRARGYWHFARLACFAISPVMLGGALVAVSGVAAEWTWHIFIILSTILMFRAMVNTSLDNAQEEKSEVSQ